MKFVFSIIKKEKLKTVYNLYYDVVDIDFT